MSKSRVQLMCEAVQAGREGGSALKGKLYELNWYKRRDPMDHATARIVGAYQTLDPAFHANLDSTIETDNPLDRPRGGAKPVGLVISNHQGSAYVQLVWTASAVQFLATSNTPTVVVPLIAADAGERMGDALEKVITAFFDRNQPKSGVKVQ